MPLPFETQGKGVLNFDFVDHSDLVLHQKLQIESVAEAWTTNKQLLKQSSCYLGSEPTSVLDARSTPSPATSTFTLSSSLGSSGSGGSPPVTGQEKRSSMGMDEFEHVLSDFGAGVLAAPSPDQSMLGYFFGDHDQVDDPSLVNLNKFMHGSMAPDFSGEMSGGFGGSVSESCSAFPLCNNGSVGFGSGVFGQLGSMVPISVSQQVMGSFADKPRVFNPHVVINQHQIQPSENPALFLPMGFGQQEHSLIQPPNPKRLNTGMVSEHGNFQIPKMPFPLRDQQQHEQGSPHNLQLHQNPPPNRLTPGMATGAFGGGEAAGFHQQAIVEDIIKAVELIQVGNLVLAQGILARLNHQLSPIGKPFQRVAFYFKESLQLLLEMNGNSSNVTTSTALSNHSPSLGHILKIGAYKSFSEASPVVHFANFTCNQAILESVERFDKIHVIDFDIGYGGQWASLMQELALRNGTTSLKITAFASPSTHDDLEFGLVLENLNQFASEIELKFELRIRSLDALTSMPHHVSNGEAIVVNLPVGAFSSYPQSLPLVLRVIKQLSPKIMVSLDRGCDRNDLPFPYHTVHALHSYATLLESLDASIMNLDALQKIERFFIHPSIERMLVGRHLSPEKISPWRSIFLSSGFSPYQFSNITESQADYLVQRTPSGGFHVEKRQSSIVLCWQQKELISASAWRC